MSFINVRLILAREIRDQLRDRRTIFMIFVLPLLLYPLLGTAYFEMVQFQTQKAMNVLVVGGGQLADAATPLIEKDSFSPNLFFDGPDGAKLLKLEMASDAEADVSALVPKQYDAALIFPSDFAKRVDAYRKAIRDKVSGTLSVPLGAGVTRMPDTIPRPKIIYTAANERSLMACSRLTAVLDRWTEEVGKTNLAAGGLPETAVKPFEVESANLAGVEVSKSTNVWSRLLPILLLLWTMTGAFYPAIDLCAGEKERGTLETLLTSPAARSEIVVGKLLTVMAFSMITAAINLACVGLTGGLIMRQMQGFGGPSALAIVWLVLAMLPVSALFSALCLALASFARSTKEGQYYLMPLMMLSLPLAVLPMSPGVELNLGNSMMPVSGLVLLLKTLLEGNYVPALQFMPIVLAVTLASCWLAVRWAVEQFNKESVLFRECERFSLDLWLKQLWRDRQPTPTAAAGLFGGVAILVLTFLFRSAVAPAPGFDGFARITLLLQFGVIALPAVLLAVLLTSNPRQTLLLRLPKWQMIPAAAMLALALHPFIVALNSLVVTLYPVSPEIEKAIAGLEEQFAPANLWLLILCIAAAPAICEELAFRGFILSGCRKLGGSTRAIIVSALFFGITHAFLQQSINAFVMGLVLGYLAVRSGSLLPGMAFHFLHNSMMVLTSKLTPELIDRVPGLGLFVHSGAQGPVYQWPVYILCGTASIAILGWLAWPARPRRTNDIIAESLRRPEVLEGVAG